MIEEMYKDFCKKVGVDEETLHAVERVERKRCFMAGAMSTFVEMTVKIAAVQEEEKSLALMTQLEDELVEYWKLEAELNELPEDLLHLQYHRFNPNPDKPN